MNPPCPPLVREDWGELMFFSVSAEGVQRSCAALETVPGEFSPYAQRLCLSFCSPIGLQGHFEDIIHGIHQDKLHIFLYVFGDVLNVLFVP